VRLIVTRRRDVAGRGGYQVFSSWWLKVSALPLTEISIPPKYIQYVDLCYLVAGSAPALYLVGVRAPVREWDQERAAIEAEPKLRLDPNVQYDILLAVAGRNTHASYWRVGLSWQLPTSSRPASLGEDDVRAAVKLSEPRRVARFLELEDIETLSRALSD